MWDERAGQQRDMNTMGGNIGVGHFQTSRTRRLGLRVHAGGLHEKDVSGQRNAYQR